MQIEGIAVQLATVRCVPSNREVKVIHETTLLDALHQAHLPVGQSCDGIGLCGFCRVQIVEGLSNLSPMGDEERKVLRSARAGDDERLACMAAVRGPVKVTTPYWG